MGVEIEINGVWEPFEVDDPIPSTVNIGAGVMMVSAAGDPCLHLPDLPKVQPPVILACISRICQRFSRRRFPMTEIRGHGN